jgi:nitrate reductase NapD
MKKETNISGVVVKTLPGDEEKVLDGLRSSGLCEVHFHDLSGRIIVTVEGDDVNEEVRKVKAIMDIPGVLCANLAYTCSDGEGGLREADRAVVVPETLRDA